VSRADRLDPNTAGYPTASRQREGLPAANDDVVETLTRLDVAPCAAVRRLGTSFGTDFHRRALSVRYDVRIVGSIENRGIVAGDVRR
jgi:hypothetical protein